MSAIACFCMTNTIIFSINADAFRIILLRQLKTIYFFRFLVYIFSVVCCSSIHATLGSACARIPCAYCPCEPPPFAIIFCFFICKINNLCNREANNIYPRVNNQRAM